ncbi:unnamed protein product, partial [marine sediment metagenome]
SLYHGNGYSIQHIADMFGCSYSTIWWMMIEYGIQRRIGSSHDEQVIIERELLNSLIHGNGYSEQHIADIFGCSRTPIRNMIKKYGITSSSRGPNVTDFTFNDRQNEIFEGCMLGDGALTWAINNCYFRNTDKHKEYLIWLQKQLGVEHISHIRPYYLDGFFDYRYELKTRVIPIIREQHIRWYPYDSRWGTNQNRNNKIIPKDIELSPIRLLFWYIGDGGYTEYEGTAHFWNYLVYEDWLHLSKKIAKLLDVASGITINKESKDDDGIQKYSLRLNRNVTNKFFDMVDDLGFDIPKCYLYKFGR